MTAISAELARDFLCQLAAMHVKGPESVDYKRGAVDLADQLALYLEALMDTPADDRMVEAA